MIVADILILIGCSVTMELEKYYCVIIGNNKYNNIIMVIQIIHSILTVLNFLKI